MDTMTSDLVIDHEAMAGLGEVVPLCGVVGASGVGVENWASLLTLMATSDREIFFFAFDRPLTLGLSTWVRYRVEDYGMVTVDCFVSSVTERGGWFEIGLVRCESAVEEFALAA